MFSALVLKMSLAAKIFKRFFSNVAQMSASIFPLLIMTLVEWIKVQAWSSWLISRSLISCIIWLLEEKVFSYLAFFIFLFSWTLKVGFNMRLIQKLAKGLGLYSGFVFFPLLYLSKKVLFQFVAKKPSNDGFFSKLDREIEFFLLVSSKIWRFLT